MPGERVRAAAALGDQALVQAMREGSDIAWTEFDHRFRPLLRASAQRACNASEDIEALVTDVLDDAAMRLGTGQREIPRNLVAHLLRALRSAHLTRTRNAARRARWHRDAAATDGTPSAQAVVLSAYSEAMVRAADPARVAEGTAEEAEPLGVGGALSRTPIGRWIRAAGRELKDDDWRMLGWVSAQVPRRSIADWVDEDYEAVKRRLTRLVSRLRARALSRIHELSPDDRREILAWLRRAGVSLPPAVAPGRAQVRRDPERAPSDDEAAEETP